MATLSAPLNIYPYSNWHLQQRGIWNFNTTGGSPSYVHMKTNIYAQSQDSMYMFEAVGYNYGAASPIRCAWGIYTYSGTLYQTGVANIYSGLNDCSAVNIKIDKHTFIDKIKNEPFILI
jgi:hypothetical protein